MQLERCAENEKENFPITTKMRISEMPLRFSRAAANLTEYDKSVKRPWEGVRLVLWGGVCRAGQAGQGSHEERSIQEAPKNALSNHLAAQGVMCTRSLCQRLVHVEVEGVFAFFDHGGKSRSRLTRILGRQHVACFFSRLFFVASVGRVIFFIFIGWHTASARGGGSGRSHFGDLLLEDLHFV